MLNSAPEKQDEFIEMADLKIYPAQLRAKREEEDDIDLSLRDVNILKLFYNRPNEVIDRNALLDECWGKHIMPESRTVDQHISQLRKRVELDPQNPKILRTVHGAGYKYET